MVAYQASALQAKSDLLGAAAKLGRDNSRLSLERITAEQYQHFSQFLST
jgi:hypothetical protein